ncbi:TPA: hypothetical protein N3A45_001060 [Salmonella enterica subsp. salamae serovar [1],40:z35:e,n,x,z15]|nr:hypothetical protein [Salmonella enterica]HCM1998003.1 hypothetical protein [Salmonella enterica subsp. salamae serovar [1],40:z35:e,n,x,z15]
MFTLYNIRDFSRSARLEDFEKILSPREGLRLARVYYELDYKKYLNSSLFEIPERKWDAVRYSTNAYRTPPIDRYNPVYDQIKQKLRIGWIVAVDYHEHWCWSKNPFYFDEQGELVYKPFMPDIFDDSFKDYVINAYQKKLDREQGRKPRPTKRDQYGAPSYIEPAPKQLTVAPRLSCPVEDRTPVDAGFCVLPYEVKPSTYETYIFANPPKGTRELYRKLNPDMMKKPGSILIVVHPEKQDAEQIKHLTNARDKIDNALEPLNLDEARFLYQNRHIIDMFTSYGSDYGGILSDMSERYFGEIEHTLIQIQEAYKNQYLTRGMLISEQFFVERRQLFKKLDGIFLKIFRERIGLAQYDDIKKALRLSSSSIVHKWNQTGVNDIEGYATYIEKSAKLAKLMKTFNKVSIGLSALNGANSIYDACTIGRDCEKTAYTEIGKFSGGLAAPVVFNFAVKSTSTVVCSIVLAALSAPEGGVGAIACEIVVPAVTSFGVSKAGEAGGEMIGESIYNTVK